MNNEYPFFSYFHRAQREGLTDAEAYRWAITEDIYDAQDNLLKPDSPRPNGMCYHPQYAVENLHPNPFLDHCKMFPKQHGCSVCGALLDQWWVGKLHYEKKIYWAKPVKIPTRQEQAMAAFAAMAAATQNSGIE